MNLVIISKIFAEISFIFKIKYKKLGISSKDIFLESMVNEPKTLYEIYCYFKNSYGIEISVNSVKRKVKTMYKGGYLQICFPPQNSDLIKLSDKQISESWFELSKKGEQYCLNKYLVDN